MASDDDFGSFEDYGDSYSPRSRGDVAAYSKTYQACIKHLCEAMEEVNEKIVPSGDGPKAKFIDCVDQILGLLRERGEGEGGRVKAACVEDISPNQLFDAMNTVASDLAGKLSTGGRKWIHVRKFLRYSLNYLGEQGVLKRRINVADGNFDRLYGYVCEFVERRVDVEHHGNGNKIDTAKVRILG